MEDSASIEVLPCSPECTKHVGHGTGRVDTVKGLVEYFEDRFSRFVVIGESE